ncbi:GMC family oxidoreductase [Clostridium polyendosporum]|uniref:GMC family oxidoreductase n=1 Tax=Clostridium polyendosporum TaxID=69208 RepID=A0A919RXC0_9CLOT|nr:GMC family oxidoreductase [Clostridium polyendosporum]GIM28220.1 GMC family oxidoreductase [Clostridium polyendosporum]
MYFNLNEYLEHIDNFKDQRDNMFGQMPIPVMVPCYHWIYGFQMLGNEIENDYLGNQMNNVINVPPPCSPVTLSYMDHWIPEVSLDEMAKTDYDVIIVGTGMGGGAALWRLCEQWKNSGKRIGIVEAGGFLLPTHAQNIATMNMERFDRYLLNPKISKQYKMQLPEFSGAAEVIALGGRSLFWTCACPRLYSEEFKNWPITSDEIADYYYIAEEVMNVSKIYSEQSTFNKILLNRLITKGFTEATTVPLATDLVPTNYAQIHSNVFFDSNSFFGRALNNRQFDLAVNARVAKVLIEKNKVTGVKVFSKEKKPYFLKAKTVILSASTLETPRILLNSEIRSSTIGHYLINHSFITATGKVNISNFSDLIGPISLLVPQAFKRPYQIQLKGPNGYYWYHYKRPSGEQWEFTLQGFGSVEPRYENRIFLDPTKLDEYGVPEIQAEFSYSENDQYVIRQMTRTLEQVASAMDAQLVSQICLQPPGFDFHEAGTCRMGNDPNTSATNRYGQIHGVTGLYVADKSVLPTVGGANPTLSVVALAARTVDHIVDQLK